MEMLAEGGAGRCPERKPRGRETENGGRVSGGTAAGASSRPGRGGAWVARPWGVRRLRRAGRLQPDLHRHFASSGRSPTCSCRSRRCCSWSLGLALVIGTEGIDLSSAPSWPWPRRRCPLPRLRLARGLGLSLFVGIAGRASRREPRRLCRGAAIVATLALLVAGRGLAQIFTSGQLLSSPTRSCWRWGQARPFGIPAP
jgi:hypothetical protein